MQTEPQSNACAELGALISAGRERLKLTQAELGEQIAEKCGSEPLSKATISAWEVGTRVPGRAHLEALGTLFGWTEAARARHALLAQRAAVLLAA